jgi:ribonuclease HI
MKTLRIYADGASRGNPGPASYGVCIMDESGNTVCEVGEAIGRATNNVAEYNALIRAFQEARRLGADAVDLYTDSQLVVRQYSGEYRVKDAGLRELLSRVRELSAGFKSVTVTHVPRSSHPGNTRADKLANIALDRL